MGSAGRFQHGEMAKRSGQRNVLISKKGTFPAMSRTGNWQAVGHYTQMVWRATTSLGCAAATRGDGLTRLCHYAPPRNILGKPVF